MCMLLQFSFMTVLYDVFLSAICAGSPSIYNVSGASESINLVSSIFFGFV